MSRFERIEISWEDMQSRCDGVRRDDPRDPRTADQADRTRMTGSSHWLLAADRERRNGNFENALRSYSRVLELEPLAIAGWIGQVQMLVHLGEYPEAEIWSRKALEMFPRNGDLLAGRAQSLCRFGQARLARQVCDHAIECAGDSSYRWMVRGETLLANGETAANHCFRRTLTLDHDWLVELEIALIYRHYALPAKAVTHVRESLQIANDQVFAWYLLGECQADLELKDAARRSFERCLELVPEFAAAQSSLVQLSTRSFSLLRWARRHWQRMSR